jgi:hypothetical protein
MNNVEMLKNIINYLLKENAETRRTLLKEDTNLLRSYIRHCIHEVVLEIKSNEQKEDLIRRSVKQLIREAEATGGSPETPSDITAMNFLKNLLKNIIPSLEEGYKELTSSKGQRVSFRKHILNAAENLLNNLDADPEVIDNEGLEEITIKVGDDDEKPEGFIDIYGDEGKGEDSEEELPPEEEFARGLEGRKFDKTGRNAAFESFNKVHNQIENEYSKLDPDAVVEGREETEREIFRDYLLLNLKLYFDKFEEDLSSNPDPEEPTTPSEDEFVRTGEERVGGEELIPPEEAGL